MKKQTDFRTDEYPMKAKLSTDSGGFGAQSDQKTFVVGEDEREIPEFVPTKEEVIHLAKYWVRRRLQVRFWVFNFEQCSRSEWCEERYALNRIDQIAEILPEQELNQAIKEAERDFKQDIGDDVWEIFKNGTEEQCKSYREKLWQES
jgi:hypothetical protein